MTSKAKSFLVLVCGACFALAGCAVNQVENTSAVPKDPSKSMVCMPKSQAFPIEAAAKEQPAQKPTALVKEQGAKETSSVSQKQVEDSRFSPLKSVYFEFGSYVLDDAAKAALDQFFQIAMDDKTSYVLEGFCDERGDEAYNLALGENRSKAVQKYLLTRGIDTDRLTLMSYGLEYPADPGHSEEAWRLNRRVEIVFNGAPKPSSIKRYGQEK